MGFSYPTQFRDEARRRMLLGEQVEVLAVQLGVAAGTLYRWKHQALVDAGRKSGIKSYELDELAKARHRIKELETELETVKAASALFNGEEISRSVVPETCGLFTTSAMTHLGNYGRVRLLHARNSSG